MNERERRRGGLHGIWVRAEYFWVHWLPQGDDHC